MSSSKPLVEMAKLLRRSNLPVVRKTHPPSDLPPGASNVQPKNVENSQQVLQRPVLDPVLTKQLDSWDIRNRPPEMNTLVSHVGEEGLAVEPIPELDKPKPKRKPRRGDTAKAAAAPEPQAVPTEKVPESNYFDSPSAPGFVERKVVVKRMAPEKVRNVSMMVSVSAEEHRLIMEHVSNNGMAFASWARQVIFKAMGRKAPARPLRKK